MNARTKSRRPFELARGRTGSRLLLILAVAGLVACSGSRSEPTRVSTADLELEASLEPAAGRIGANQLWIELSDADGKPVRDADLAVKVHMVAMGAMPPMGGAASVSETEAGRYRADFELEMGGTWIVEIEAKRPGARSRRIEGSLTVGSEGVRLRAEGGASEPAGPGGAEEPHRHPAEFSFDPGRLQKVGVRTSSVETTQVGRGLRTVGRVVVDETRLADVSLKVSGWVEDLRADATGIRVERGDVLFTLYSPQLYAAQQELLQAQASEGPLGDALERAARNRLRLWGIDRADIDRIAGRSEPLEAVPVRAPVSGYVIEKNLVAGSSVTPGQRLMRIAPLDQIWIEIDLYEAELSLVRIGQTATVTLSHLPGRLYEGKVTFVYPYLAGETRTARARIELANPELELRPDMFANVELPGETHEALVVPESAVLHAGERQFVFIALGEGRFRPQEVILGLRQQGRLEIVKGLVGDEQVVSSGTFLIASESRLRAGLDQW